ncbi:hypothetical protein Fcan01_28107 [Folsomia candida]|uniref:Uncharacterized protein n=1 Tax=Folsomia candida TaxID=158441 RepID=A0A226CX61_FOLCA|nr:hypothetical protein Fcan01_28107 [Folsomia candida]
MSDDSFVLVKFEETNEIEVVTTAWLRQDDTKCVWPNYKNPNRIVKSVGLHMAAEANWSLHEVKVLGGGHKFGTYHEAVKKLPNVMDQSDADIGNGDGKSRIRREKGKLSDSSDSDVGELFKSNIMPPPPRMIINSEKTVNSLVPMIESTKERPSRKTTDKKTKAAFSSLNMPFKLCLVNQKSSVSSGSKNEDIIVGNPDPDRVIAVAGSSTNSDHVDLDATSELTKVTIPATMRNHSLEDEGLVDVADGGAEFTNEEG